MYIKSFRHLNSIEFSDYFSYPKSGAEKVNLIDVYLISTFISYMDAVPELLDVRTERDLAWVLKTMDIKLKERIRIANFLDDESSEFGLN